MTRTFSPVASTSRTVADMFTDFSAELVANQDRRERIVKASRDCTALSKRLIFHLHRIAGTQPVPRDKLFREARGKEAEILAIFERISVELQGEDAWRHHRAVAPGIEEFVRGPRREVPVERAQIEAVSFFRYLEHRILISLADVRALFAPFGLLVTEDDYLCGLADMTGELMRLGINSVSGELLQAKAAVSEAELVIRLVKRNCEPLVPHTRFLGKKMAEMDRSLRKLEDASYSLALKGAEYADAPAALRELLADLSRPAPPPHNDNTMDDDR